ncbi:F-box family protein [Dorcoceras hygrometricum]|uniref:F-box family protein n=1 Tax=Dorcoceras hygrometricum TaxID=472368 RepID=A0A2Z7BUV6_9LAMI|nr:F-box family protein [Dorcoceras hygrometricum]
MSLFDIQDVCIAIGSIATLDLPMVVDPIGIYGLKGPYWIQLAVGPQPLWLRNHNFRLAQRIMVKRLATSPHDPLGITDSACKNQSVMVSVQYGPFNPYIPIRSTTIGKSRAAIDPIAMHTSWRSNSDITSVTSIGYPRMSASGESSTTMHRLLHASGSHPIPTPYYPNEKYKRRRFVRSGYSVGRRDLPRQRLAFNSCCPDFSATSSCWCSAVLFTVILPDDSRRFRPPFFTIELALDSSREALSPYTHFGGCCWLEQKIEATVIRPWVGAFRLESDFLRC